MNRAAGESDYRQVVDPAKSGRFLPGTAIEIIREPAGRGGYRFALFDFDGTLSLIREGWTDVMVAMMVEVLRETPDAESDGEIEAVVRDFVGNLTGKQTIYQMIRLAEEVNRRGGKPLDPQDYKQAYLERLMLRISDRREALRCGRATPDEMLTPGSVELLRKLADRGVTLYLASGTDEEYVAEEAELLDLPRFFGSRIYGALKDYKSFSKEMVIGRILSENSIDGMHLLGFGDGYVEIENVKAAGGAAIGVATDEAGRGGKPDAWKRSRLVGVGADVIIPDFRESGPLLQYLFTEEPNG